MTCCTPQEPPTEVKDTPTATSVDGDTEMKDAFTQRCQDMFAKGMPDCCAQMLERTHTGVGGEADDSKG